MKIRANFGDRILCRIVILVLFVFTNERVLAYDFITSGIYNKTSQNTVEVTYCYYKNNANGEYYTGDIMIPESVTYDGTPYNVTGIGEWAFYYCSNLTSITIPNSVKSIGSYAFFGCTSLSEITIPDGVTTIEEQTFNSCWSLTTAIIGNGVTSIGKQAFSYCPSLTKITIPESVTSIGGYAFYGSSGLTSITIPEGVTSIGEYTFKYCTGLTKATIGSGVTSIGECAFYDCTNLLEINSKNPIPPTVSSSSTFEGVDKSTCILNVPIGSKNLYANADYWKEFSNINETDFMSNINNVTFDGEVEELERYTIDGIRINTPKRGINIIKYSDGTTKKVVVK